VLKLKKKFRRLKVNFVISFYFLVSFEEIEETVGLNVALNCVSLQPQYCSHNIDKQVKIVR
jgi:hypothetical protein